MANTSEHWIWKYDRWVIETEKEYIYKPLAKSFINNLKDGLTNIGTELWSWFVSVLPDLIGFGAIATGAFVILSSMGGRGVVKPLGIFSGITIVAVCILGAE